ncbi:phospholipase A [Massilia sp. LXY-6]|uniref:phospholipase A n=1 Tax=Massilia sp. LXY-6 TaxID=3379823 RepID=UPI003EE40F94
MSTNPYRFLPLLPFLVIAPVLAQQGVPDLSGCACITDASLRLACYDHLVGVNTTPSAGATAASLVAQVDHADQTSHDLSPEKTRGFSLADHWELDQEHRRGVFNFRPHHATYLMVTRSAHPNNEPYRPFRNLADFNTDLSHNELVYQLSFKTKVAEDIASKPVDLWFGYTQNSFWQAGNRQASSPFRETNYQPELMAVTPLNFNVLGMHASFLNLGLVHQSNGQASTLSRSWNRVYAQVGLERAGFTVLGRVWKRINEAASDDDNPDIVDYMGRGDLAVTYRSSNGHDYSALLRRNFSTNRGAVQLSWAFPLAGHFKGYTQYFSGYGQSLIDYNYYQNVVGLGLLGTF